MIVKVNWENVTSARRRRVIYCVKVVKGGERLAGIGGRFGDVCGKNRGDML
jgi:hypothetical protein